MMLSDRGIRARLDGQHEDGTNCQRLVIEPLRRPNSSDDGGAIQGCAVDLRLGTWFEIPRLHTRAAYELDEPGPRSPGERPGKTVYVPFGGCFFLHPGNFVMAVTLEWLGMPADLSGTVTGKSKWGRRGLNVATATLVHPNFVGCLTLELANIGEHPITLKPGVTVCQLSLQQLSSAALEPVKGSFLMGHRRPVHADVVLDTRAAALSKGGSIEDGVTETF
ncbi:MAG: dcd [Gemmatimonadetes bacterium]|nr:dcd [Gemmatimonadota bacterium]